MVPAADSPADNVKDVHCHCYGAEQEDGESSDQDVDLLLHGQAVSLSIKVSIV